MAIDHAHLFDALPTPYMVVDSEFRFVVVNRAYEAAVMRPRAELVGRKVFDLFPNDGPGGERMRQSFRQVFTTGQADTVAYIPYDIPVPKAESRSGEGKMQKRFWTAVHSPLADDNGTVRWLVQNTVDVTAIARLREQASLPFSPVSGEAQLLERAQEAEDRQRALIDESEEFRRLFQQAPGFFAVLSGPDHVFSFANDAYLRLVGTRDLIGKPVSEALPEVVEQGFTARLDKVYRTGEPTGGEAIGIMLQRVPGEAPQESFVDFSYAAIRGRDGAVTGIFVQGMDRTEAVRTQMRQRLLLDELNHRVKNTLATVQSIASLTLRNATDLVSARRDFEARIVALSNAHNLLSISEWTSASLSDIFSAAFALPGPGRTIVDGPPVVLSPKASIAMAMVIHELTTNAMKYGALTSRQGQIVVSWSIDADSGNLVIEWAERHGQPVRRPTRQGFGTRMISTVVVGELGGSFEPRYESAGLTARIVIDASVLGECAAEGRIDG